MYLLLTSIITSDTRCMFNTDGRWFSLDWTLQASPQERGKYIIHESDRDVIRSDLRCTFEWTGPDERRSRNRLTFTPTVHTFFFVFWNQLALLYRGRCRRASVEPSDGISDSPSKLSSIVPLHFAMEKLLHHYFHHYFAILQKCAEKRQRARLIPICSTG